MSGGDGSSLVEGLIGDDSLLNLMADDIMDFAEDEVLVNGASSQQTKTATGNPSTCTSVSSSKKSAASGKKKKSAASFPTESFEYITTDQINEHDVLCGRGAGIVNNPGNAHFRTLVVPRRDEYMASGNDNARKDAVARSICQHIRTELVPAGRFLKRATPAQASGWGFVGEEAAADVWVPVDEKTMLDRAKQSLREKDVKYIDKIKKGQHHLKRTKDKARRAGGGTTAGSPSVASSASSHSKASADPIVSSSITSAIGTLAVSDIDAPSSSASSSHPFDVPQQQALQEQVQQQVLFASQPEHVQQHALQNHGSNGRGGGSQVQMSAQPYQVPQQQLAMVAAMHSPESPAPSHTSASPDTFAMGSKGSISVKDWISAEMIRAMSLHGSQVQEADRYYQLKAVRLALALLETVSLYHQNSMAFGGSTVNSGTLRVTVTDDAIPDAHSLSSTSYNVAITGATLQSPLSSSKFDEDVKVDLANVGAVLYELFSGVPPFQNQEEAELFDALAAAVMTEEDESSAGPSKKRRERTPSSLRDLGLPVAIDALVMELMGTAKDSVVQDQKQLGDFIGDVQRMVDDPDRCLFDIEDESPEARYKWGQEGYRLEFPQDTLYGRDAEMGILSLVFDRTIRKGGPVEAVTVSGYSGIGKTSLISQLHQPTIENRGFFISAKFDKLRQAKPLSAIANALGAFCLDLISRRQDQSDTYDSICASMRAISDDGGGSDPIFELIPNLGKILPKESQEGANRSQSRRASNGGAAQDIGEVDKNALNRFMFFFRKFFHAIAGPSHPVVLFIDDLQWADAMSLDLIRSIVCESDAHSFLFVGSYRSNEVDQDHPLLSHLGQIRTAGVPLLSIELSSMDRASVNALISDTLKLSPLMTRPLADAVHTKTSGNCLFVIELLSDLHRQGLLRYSVSSRRWEWDDKAIVALDIQANAVDLMRRKLLRLGATEMWSVKVAACLGAETKESTLDLLSFGLGLTSENGVVALLRRPVEEGLLVKVGNSYRFSHDQIQQAAYSLVTVEDRPLFHLRLGRSLIKAFTAFSEEADGDVLFTCADQLNRGSSEIKDRAEKVRAVQLNLQAAKSSILSSTFLAASIYLRFALSYLDESSWENNYSLCLEVYSSLSETEYVTGKYEAMTMVLNEVFARAKTFDDKLRAYFTLIRASTAQNELNVAANTCFEVLGQLGEPFEEKEVDHATVVREVASIKSILENKDVEWFMSQNVMTDRRILNLMRFMSLNIINLYYTNPSKLLLVISRMVRLTVRHGMCKVSATAFSAYGMVCCGFLGDHAEGYRMGKIAKAIVEKFNAQELVAQTNTLLCVINQWTEPLQSTFSPLVAGYDAGISSGDTEYAIMCKQIYLMTALQCGQPLNEFLKKCIELDKEIKQYRMDMQLPMTHIHWQCALNLIGNSASGQDQSDPTLLEGTAVQGDSFLEAQLESNRKGGPKLNICQYYFLRLVLAYTFGRDEVAAEMYDKCMEAEVEKMLAARYPVAVFALYAGLTALAMSRIDPTNSKWNEIAHRLISKMEKWASSSAWNFEHKLCFLRAEKMGNAGDRQGATALYEQAAKLSREHGFVSEEAVVCERYGAFLRRTGDEDSARHQYDKAFEAYKKWGALRKCVDLKETAEVPERILRTSYVAT